MYLNNPKDDTAVAKNATKEAYMSTEFLSGLSRDRYGVLLNDLHNAFRMVHNKYPNTLVASYDLSINWKVDAKRYSV